MDVTSIQELASDISQLKWMLSVVAALLGLVVVMLVFAFTMLVKAVKNTEQRVESRLFRDQADNFLDGERHNELVELAKERVKQAPGDAMAHFYLATALYRLGSLVEAKQSYLRAGELDPVIRRSCEDTIQELEVALANNRPRSVT